jgi:hypothetical protein
VPDGYKAGSAYVPVLPDFRDFHKRIGAEFASLEPQAAKAGEKSGAAYGKAFAERVRASDARIRVDADTATANAKIREVSRDRKVKLRIQTEFLRSPLTLGALGGLALGPQAIGLGLGAAGIGTAFGAAAAGAVSFGALAKSELDKVTAAQKALTTAQKQYDTASTKAGRKKALQAEATATAGLSSSEKQLGKQVLGVEDAWKRLGKAQAPLIARSLLPWTQTAREGLRFLPALARPAANAIGLLGNEARVALQSPFWKSFSKTLGETGEIGIQTFGESVGHVADGLAHLFTTFAPDIDKLPVYVDKAAGSFDRWASSIHRSGLEAFLHKTFSHANLATLKGDMTALGSTLGHVGSAISQLSPSAFLGLSKVLEILSKLTPDQITAIAALYSVSKLTGGLPGNLLAKGAGAVGSAVLGSAVGQAVSGALKTALAKTLSTIGLKGLAGKVGSGVAGAGDAAAAEAAGTEVTAAVEASSAEIIAAITGLGIDIDAAVAASTTAIAAAVEESSLNVVAAIGASKAVDVIGKLLPHVPGLGSLFSKVTAPDVNWGPVTRGFRGQVEAPVNAWFRTQLPREARTSIPPGAWAPVYAGFRREVEGPISAWLSGGLHAAGISGGKAAGAGIASGAASQKGAVAGAAGRLRAALIGEFRSAEGILYNTGALVIGGLESGMKSAWGGVIGWLEGRARDIIAHKGPPAYDAVLLKPAGLSIMKSLAAGLQSGYGYVRATLQSIAPKIAAEYASLIKAVEAQIKAKTGNPAAALLATAQVKAFTAQFSRLDSQYKQVQARIAAAKQFAAQTASNTTSSFGIAAAGAPGANGKTPAVGGILGNLSGYLHKIRAFGHNLSVLGQRGLNKAYLAQLAQLGPEQGGPIAAELATATDAQLGQVNAAEFQISKSAGQLGKLSANLIYDSGPAFGKSFLSGLKGQEKALRQEMRDLAKVLAVALATELHLPGVTLPPTGGSLALKLVYDGPSSGPIKALMQDMRAEIIYAAGGDVQKALGRGRGRT